MKPNQPLALLILYICIALVSGCKKSEDTKIVVPPADTVTDIDGNVYHTVQIGTQVWLRENLAVTHYRNGDPVQLITDAYQWIAADSGAYCNYNNDASLVPVYGRLYNWYAVMDSRMLSPAGWHIPTDEEWKTLEKSLGMTAEQADSVFYHGTTEGGKLKEAGTTHWYSPNAGATNSSGFCGLPGGYRADAFISLTTGGFWWSTSKATADEAIFMGLSYDKGGIVRSTYHGNAILGLSIRCVKD
jgi:uncharacterized protein (TIGR02145 family)